MEQKPKKGFKRFVTWGNAGNLLFWLLLIFVFVSPTAKGILLQGLMKIGLFQPDVSANARAIPVANHIVFGDATGKEVSLSSLKGKVVFINFWATWCPPCLAEMPSINALNQKISGNSNIVILMVDVDGNLKRSAPFMKKHGYNLTAYRARNDIPESMLGAAIPSTVIINKRGQMVFKHDGVADYDNDKMLQYFQKLSAE